MANYFNGGLVFDKATGLRISNQTATLLDAAGAAQPTYDQAGAAVQVTTDNDGFFQPFTADIKRGFLVFGAGFRYEVISSTVLDQADQAYEAATNAAQVASAAKAAADKAVPNTRKVNSGRGTVGGGALDTDVAIGIADGVAPLTAATVSAGSLDNLGLGWAVIQHTNTPSGTWGAYQGILAGNNVLIQRFCSDGADRTLWYERIRTGAGTVPDPHAFSAWSRTPVGPQPPPPTIIASRGLSSNQSIPTYTSTQVSWTKVGGADNGSIPYAGNSWTIPTAGRYSIQTTITYGYKDSTTWNLRQVGLYINGNQAPDGFFSEDRTAAAVCSMHRYYNLAAGDAVRVQVSQHTGQNLDIIGGQTVCNIVRIGA